MHSLQLELSEFSRRRGSVEMTVDASFAHTFDIGERILINDPATGWWSAVVAEADLRPGDVSYRINLTRQMTLVQAHRTALIAASRRFSAN